MSNSSKGFVYSLTAAVMWGILPVFLTICLQSMDSVTITWYRFAFAGLLVFFVLKRGSQLPQLSPANTKVNWLLAIAIVGLVVNYVLNVLGLKFLPPESAQVLMQVAPFMLLFGGILVYQDRLTHFEWLGVLVLISGLLLFFNQRLATLFSSFSEYTLGIVLILLAAAGWAGYALCQKVLLKTYSAKQLTMLIYLGGSVILLPFTGMHQIFNMSVLQLAALLFCCVNTVIAYGAFTEALNIWQASKVSAVVAISPVFTFLSVQVGARLWPEYLSITHFNQIAMFGAVLVVTGSVVAALGRRKN